MISSDLRKWVGELARAAAPLPVRAQQMINSDLRKWVGELKQALVAQLDRASDSDSEGRAFESHQAHQQGRTPAPKPSPITWTRAFHFVWLGAGPGLCLKFASVPLHRKPSPITWTGAFHFVWLGAGPGLCLKFVGVPLHRKPSPIKTDTYIEILPLSVTKHSGALCIFMLLS